MRPAKNQWPNTSGAKGALFVAQMMREMFSVESFESFRVPALDLHARIRETSALVNEVRSDRLPRATLTPLLSELMWSISTDLVAKKLASEEYNFCVEYIEKINIEKIDLRQLSHMLAMMTSKLIVNYKSSLENEIISLYSSREKIKLRGLVQSYCAHLVNLGYSKQYMLEEINRRFFTDDIVRIDARTMRRFFSTFSGEDRRFRVWVAMRPRTADFIRRLDIVEIKNSGEIPLDIVHDYTNNNRFDRNDKFVCEVITAKDAQGAARLILNKLHTISAITFLGKNALDLSWDDVVYIKTLRGDAGMFVRTGIISFQSRKITVSGRTGKYMRKQTQQVLKSFDGASSERLISAINTAALARASNNPENQLISLWSAVEVLLSDPPGSKPRIVHYIDAVIPCICSKYARRYIVALSEELQVIYKKNFIKLLNELPGVEIALDVPTKFSHLLFDGAHEAGRSSLMQMCRDNPLALYRLWKVNKDFGTPGELKKTLEDHEKRVQWQLHRIYRARNQLVHSGKVPSYLESLVLNAFEYFTSAVVPILGTAARETAESDIDQVVAELGFTYKIYKTKIGNMDPQQKFASDQIVPIFK